MKHLHCLQCLFNRTCCNALHNACKPIKRGTIVSMTKNNLLAVLYNNIRMWPINYTLNIITRMQSLRART